MTNLTAARQARLNNTLDKVFYIRHPEHPYGLRVTFRQLIEEGAQFRYNDIHNSYGLIQADNLGEDGYRSPFLDCPKIVADYGVSIGRKLYTRGDS